MFALLVKSAFIALTTLTTLTTLAMVHFLRSFHSMPVNASKCQWMPIPIPKYLTNRGLPIERGFRVPITWTTAEPISGELSLIYLIVLKVFPLKKFAKMSEKYMGSEDKSCRVYVERCWAVLSGVELWFAANAFPNRHSSAANSRTTGEELCQQYSERHHLHRGIRRSGF